MGSLILESLVELFLPILLALIYWVGEALLFVLTLGLRGFAWRPFGELAPIWWPVALGQRFFDAGQRRLVSLAAGLAVGIGLYLALG